MDSTSRLKWTLLLLLAGIIATGCTKKDNLTGNNWSGIDTLSVKDTLNIGFGYSYPADELTKIKGTESKLLTANQRSATSISYLRFTGMPASTTIHSVVGDSCYIKVKLIKSSANVNNPLSLSLHRVNKALPDTIEASLAMDISPDPLAIYTLSDSVSITGKEIKFALDTGDLIPWEVEADTLGWNLAIKVDSGWIEIASNETVFGPKLNLRYKTSEEGSWNDLSKKPDRDTYFLEAPEGIASETWKIDNLTSTRLFIKYSLQDTLNTMFHDNNGQLLSLTDLRRMTVNKAVLVLHVKPNTNTYYTGSTSFSLYPFNVVKENINGITNLVKADYEQIIGTDTSNGVVEDDRLEIEITPLVQAYSSGDKEPLGIMIQSLQERQNFGSLEFYDNLSATPPDKMPYVRIIYTPPFL